MRLKFEMGLFCFAGHVSLPGGRTDEGDADDIRTALREAEEEIGLDPTLVDVVAVLEPFVTKVKLSSNQGCYNSVSAKTKLCAIVWFWFGSVRFCHLSLTNLCWLALNNEFGYKSFYYLITD